MAPFFGGVAIGLAILIPVVLAMFAIRLLYLFCAFIYGFIVGVSRSPAKRPVTRAPVWRS
ncbi:MAG: hypothetical protein IVW54_14035 [Candidatus Binataceae bacterium]|nr:hypothetical protein [Candidatus Binataceae bacterium]